LNLLTILADLTLRTGDFSVQRRYTGFGCVVLLAEG
jgi:hypothetical protein